jgi:hypothetical protein
MKCIEVILNIIMLSRHEISSQHKRGTSRAAAPHPNPLPVKDGERERTAVAAMTYVAVRGCRSELMSEAVELN